MLRGAPLIRLSVALLMAVSLTACSGPPAYLGAHFSTGWKSGASGDGVADGSFGRWRGQRVDIAGTWNDSFDAQTEQWTVQDGMEYGDWNRDLDVAVGGIYKDRGESWADAADGAYDDRWREALRELRSAWKGRDGTLYIRFAHEFNGDWYPWSVTGDEVSDFTQAWARFHDLQEEILPEHRLVFCPNSETTADLDLDWRDAFPGAEEVDVVAVDFYNDWHWVDSERDFTKVSRKTDGKGAPLGLEAHRQFAEDVGKPFAVPEWSSNAEKGDAPEFVEELHQWMLQHAGTGGGQLLYEIQFNVSEYGDGKYELDADSKQPRAAKAYKRLW